ncbi:MAG: CHAP domain-containing protein [Clostridia bacterium]|nr:CHAP domain-containing protein [Clostridia bacterium]
MKKFIALFLAIIMCMGIFTVPASAVTYRDSFPNTHRNTGKNLADFIAVSKTQLGYTELNTKTGKPLGTNEDNGYTKYGAWFGAPTIAWCAFFVAWCANQAGISTSIIPRIGNCEIMTNWYKNNGRYLYANETSPRTGDLIFYNWGGGKIAQHIGIVTGVSGNYIYTVEGNTGSSYGYRCEAKTRTSGANYIIGYARPAYNDAKTYVGSYSFAEYAAQKYKAYQKYGTSYGGGSYSKTAQLAIITSKATEIKAKSAILNGRIENSSSKAIAYGGFYFGKDKNKMSIYGEYYGSTKKTINLSMDISKRYGKLEPATTYYYCAYGSINGEAYKGPVYSLTTVDDRPQMIVLSDENLNLSVGETYELFSAILPLEAEGAKIKWSTSDKNIVTVKDGMLTAKDTGEAVITAKTDYGKAENSCKVKVTLAPVNAVSAEIVSDKEIKISWEKDNCLEANGYEIFRSESPTGDFKKIGKVDTSTTEFIDKKVKYGRYYYYKIKTLCFFEDYDSELSEKAAIKAAPLTPLIDSIKQKNSSFIISWSETKGADEYRIYRSLMPERGYSLIGTAKGTQFTDNDILYGKKYYYKVAAVKGEYQSGFSQSQSKIAEKITIQKPDPLMEYILK